ncbi:MAG: ribose 5-phosphate isomerase B [Peptostreptococcaceae bacterium]|nr:ribose 5-phosphate isomerase B [Peptostreptococcaceae bacterium]
MKIGLSADHGGINLKDRIKRHLEARGLKVVDYGTDSTDPVDYPDYGKLLAEKILLGEVECGIAICGTGIGISIAANKVKGIRCANVSDTFSAKMAKRHNDCQMISIGERTVGPGLAMEIVDAFLDADFEQGRHAIRVDKIMQIEKE